MRVSGLDTAGTPTHRFSVLDQMHVCAWMHGCGGGVEGIGTLSAMCREASLHTFFTRRRVVSRAVGAGTFLCPYGLDKSTDIIRCAGLGRVCLLSGRPCMPAAVHSHPHLAFTAFGVRVVSSRLNIECKDTRPPQVMVLKQVEFETSLLKDGKRLSKG